MKAGNKAGLYGIKTGGLHAIVQSQTSNFSKLNIVILQAIIRTGFHKMVIILKGTVSVEFWIFSLGNDVCHFRLVKIPVKLCACCSLHTIVGPQNLRDYVQ